MEFFIISMLNGLSYGLLLFMLSSGLTLIFSMMGVLNFAHASFYMLGAYVGYSVAQVVGFWPALVIAPLVVGAMGALFERICLRRVHKFGHVAELLITFGLSYVILELVQLVWGRIALEFRPPDALQGPAFTLINDSVKGLGVLWGAAPVELCSSADAAVPIVWDVINGVRPSGVDRVFAVPGYAWLHDVGGAGDAGGGLVAADPYPHWAGYPVGTDASRCS